MKSRDLRGLSRGTLCCSESTAWDFTALKSTTGAHDEDGKHCHNLFEVLVDRMAAFVFTPHALDLVNKFPRVNPGLTRCALPDANLCELLKHH